MWALLAFSVLSLAAAIERAVALRRANVDPTPLLTQLNDALLRRRSVADALKVCAAARGPAARVAEAGLHRFSRSSSQLEKSLERRAVTEIRRLNRGLGILATVANVAPLLGFLGTVTGMMESFDALWRDGLNNPGLVALGIKEALTTTAAGLIVAVPTQIVYNTLSARVTKITADIEAMANFLLEVREEMTT
jgi:biopolymer transport protein ExbB